MVSTLRSIHTNGGLEESVLFNERHQYFLWLICLCSSTQQVVKSHLSTRLTISSMIYYRLVSNQLANRGILRILCTLNLCFFTVSWHPHSSPENRCAACRSIHQKASLRTPFLRSRCVACWPFPSYPLQKLHLLEGLVY